MGRIYRKFCEQCGKYYEKPSKRFCSQICWRKYEKGRTNADKKLPIPNVPDYNDFWKLKGDWIISSDWHLPYYDHALADNLIKIAKKFKIKKHLIAGDFTDQAAFRHMLYAIPIIDDRLREDTEYTFGICAEIINKMLEWFDEIRLLTGNHDIYFFKVLQGKVKTEGFWRLVGVNKKDFNKKFFVSQYPFCSLNGKWHVTHPKTYSRIPTNVPRALSTKYRMSTISAHGHNFGLAPDISGQDICIDSGGMFDYKKIGYKWMTDTTHPQWVSGFVVVKNNKPYIFSDTITDWDYWLKK